MPGAKWCRQIRLLYLDLQVPVYVFLIVLYADAKLWAHHILCLLSLRKKFPNSQINMVAPRRYQYKVIVSQRSAQLHCVPQSSTFDRRPRRQNFYGCPKWQMFMKQEDFYPNNGLFCCQESTRNASPGNSLFLALKRTGASRKKYENGSCKCEH